MNQDYISITIPALPPGINRTYLHSQSGVTLTPAARQWDKQAALVVGSAAGRAGFEADPGAEYEIVVRWWGGRHDTDAHLKLVQDCVTRKLGFDDRQITTCVIQRIRGEGEGVEVYLFQSQRDWVTELILIGAVL